MTSVTLLPCQVEAGQEQGSLTVLWLPVTITQHGLSNGAPVTGYIGTRHTIVTVACLYFSIDSIH